MGDVFGLLPETYHCSLGPAAAWIMITSGCQKGGDGYIDDDERLGARAFSGLVNPRQ